MPDLDASQAARYGAGRVDAAAAVKKVQALVDDHAQLHAEGLASTSVGTMEVGEMLDKFKVENLPVSVAVMEEDMDIDSGSEPQGRIVVTEQFDEEIDLPLIGDSVGLRRLGQILAGLLVEFGDQELFSTDESGMRVYDPLHPLVFGPTNQLYELTGGRFRYHASNFVFNTAYKLGLRVSVYPIGEEPKGGVSYASTALLFDALSGLASQNAEYYAEFFDVVLSPGGWVTSPPTQGDILLRGTTSEEPFGHIAIIADPRIRASASDSRSQCAFRSWNPR